LKEKSRLIKTIISLSLCLVAFPTFAKKEVNYKIKNYSCPTKAVGDLTLRLMDVFERDKSLKDLKLSIVKNAYERKYFLQNYEIKFNPIEGSLLFTYYCPKPLMKIEIFDSLGIKTFGGTLVSNGEIFKESFLKLLEKESKKELDIPYLSIPHDQINSELTKRIAQLYMSLGDKNKQKVSEIILNPNQELTFIISSSNRVASAFFGQAKWSEKVGKLEKILNHFNSSGKLPSLVNLTNSKKVVVKF
jgi:hypothetical protein